MFNVPERYDSNNMLISLESISVLTRNVTDHTRRKCSNVSSSNVARLVLVSRTSDISRNQIKLYATRVNDLMYHFGAMSAYVVLHKYIHFVHLSSYIRSEFISYTSSR